jgi:hypothetical protein
MLCTSCGFPVSEENKFCRHCGTVQVRCEIVPDSLADEQTAEAAADTLPEKIYVKTPPPGDGVANAIPAHHGRLLPYQYFSLLLLLLLPVINVVVLAVWSFSGRGNVHRQSFARGALIFLLVLTLLAGLVLAWYNIMQELYPYGWQFIWQ